MPRNMDAALLRAFATVAETGGMTKAADLLNLTQAAVSLQVKRLEELLDCRLFARDRRSLRLTPSGERLLARARRLLAINDELWSAMTGPDVTGAVRVGIPSDLMRPYVPMLLKRFQHSWPRVNVSLVSDTSQRLLAQLDRGEIDLAITGESGCGERGEILFTNPVVWAGAKGGQAWDRDPLPISTGDETCTFRPVVLNALADRGRDWRTVCEVSSLEPICATVEADLAVAPLYASCVSPTMEVLGDRHRLPVLPVFSINLYLRHTASSNAATELARHIRSQINPAEHLRATSRTPTSARSANRNGRRNEAQG